MLHFFRKNQKLFFVIVTVAIVISFLFFGTYGTLSREVATENKKIVQGAYGKAIHEKELSALCHIISSSALDPFDVGKGRVPNLFNDGVIEKDFLASKHGLILIHSYLEEVRPELESRLKQIKASRSYTHPQSKEVGAEKIWSLYTPSLFRGYKELRETNAEISMDTVQLFLQLYLEQKRLPSETLRRLLISQQNQLHLPPDPLLEQVDLSLFGFKGLSDWFGIKFINLTGQFILNVAQYAEKLGYKIKKEEVRAELITNLQKSSEYLFGKKSWNVGELESQYQMMIQSLGMNEQLLLDSWRSVMLYRLVMKDVGDSLVIDTLPFDQFEQFANENAQIDFYQLPSHLQFPDFLSMLQFQIYLEAIAKHPQSLRTDLLMPTQFATAEEVEKRIPELIGRNYQISWKSIDKKELAQTLSLKQVREWASTDPNWHQLQTQFPELTRVTAQGKEERFQILSQLDPSLRMKIDQFSQDKILDQHPEQIQSSLNAKPATTQALHLRASGGSFPLPGINNKKELLALLEKSPLQGEPNDSSVEELKFYHAGDGLFYEIEVISRDDKKTIISFENAQKEHLLEPLLNKRLEAAYLEVRKKSPRPFQQANGQFKPYREVKEEIGRLAFSDLLKSIEESYRHSFHHLPVASGDLPLPFYSNQRLLAHAAHTKEKIQQGEREVIAEPLSEQFQFEKLEQVIDRSAPFPFPKEILFTMSPAEWSTIQTGARGQIGFYQMKENKNPTHSSPRTLHQGRDILAMDAKRDFIRQLLEHIQAAHAINLSTSLEE